VLPKLQFAKIIVGDEIRRGTRGVQSGGVEKKKGRRGGLVRVYFLEREYLRVLRVRREEEWHGW
tara:strand:+ start:99 stop:290 length:192 start_codon:yes stop_codon:yes gene_type:complete